MALDNEDHEDPLVTVSPKRKVPCTSWSAAKWKTELSWMNKLSEAARGAVLPQYQFKAGGEDLSDQVKDHYSHYIFLRIQRDTAVKQIENITVVFSAT